jgi:hypothetical protein
MIGRRKLILISLVLVYAIAVPVFAYMYFYRTELNYIAAGIVLRTYDTPTMKLGFYWDSGCTQTVTGFDFGNITHPNQQTTLWAYLYVRNEGTVWNDCYWNSTLSSVTSEIAEGWEYMDPWHNFRPFNGTRIQPGPEVLMLRYGIALPAYATAGTYNWTVAVWGQHYY